MSHVTKPTMAATTTYGFCSAQSALSPDEGGEPRLADLRIWMSGEACSGSGGEEGAERGEWRREEESEVGIEGVGGGGLGWGGGGGGGGGRGRGVGRWPDRGGERQHPLWQPSPAVAAGDFEQESQGTAR